MLFRHNCDPLSEGFATFGSTLTLQEEPAGQTMHGHRPFELIVALSGDFELRLTDCEPSRHTEYVVAPLRRHAIVASTGLVARLHVDPGARYLRHGGDLPAPPDVGDLTRMLTHLHAHPSPVLASDIIDYWKASWLGWLRDARRYDDRIVAALNYLDDVTVRKANRRTVAAVVGLSPSRLGAVFQHETGMPVRRYILWRRLLLACRLIREGLKITDAALETGFSDAAHLSRVYRQAFGASPSSLQQIDVSRDIDRLIGA